MFGRIVIVIATLFIGAGLAWALWPRPIEVETARVERGSFDVMVEEEGQSRIREVFTVSAPVTGQLQRLSLHAGDTVLANETVIAIIRPAGPGLLDERSRRIAQATAETARAAVEFASTQLTQAEKQLDFAERALERTISLSQRGLVSAQVLEKAQYDLDVATSALQSAKASLGVRESELQSAEAALIEGVGGSGTDACCVELKAPVSGRILQVLTESEQVVQAGTPLLNIGDPADLEIAAELSSRDAVQLQPGAKASIDGWGGPPLAAELVRIEPMAVTKVSALGIEEQRTTATLKLLAPPTEWQRLGHGFRVVAHIVRWRGEDLLTIPIGALFRLGGDWATFVVEDGKATARRIELGERNAELAEVVAGLKAGDEVILHPADTIVSGTAVVVSVPAGEQL
ncbi:efflux RND transporter periplasmic adaptor subunit [Devosia sp. CN2-171]|uniref:efflux RND transporter periplasmic adaptor subunit n=1 Tax=Devosia sp. CN2-171 TaxID=3400909 RepID=UPI003BF8CA07